MEEIAQKEGGGASGARAARNYPAKCMQLMKGGVKWRNHALIEYNSWTKSWELLYIHKTVQPKLEKHFIRTVELLKGETSGAATTSGRATSARSQDAIMEATTTPEKGGKRAASTSEGCASGKKPKPNDDDEETKQKKVGQDGSNVSVHYHREGGGGLIRNVTHKARHTNSWGLMWCAAGSLSARPSMIRVVCSICFSYSW